MTSMQWSLLLILALFVAVNVVYRRSTRPRRSFVAEYGFEPSDEVTVLDAADDASPSLVLRFPYWRHAQPDGTAVLRGSGNSPIYPRSTLVAGNYLFESHDPQVLYALATRLRRSGVSVPMCEEEATALRERGASEHPDGDEDFVLLSDEFYEYYPKDLRP